MKGGLRSSRSQPPEQTLRSPREGAPTPHPPSPTRGPPRLPVPSCSAPFRVIPPGRPAPVPGASVPRPRRAAGFPLVEFLPRSRGASKGAIPSRRRSPALGCPGFARVVVSQVRPPEGTLERSGEAGLVPEAPPPTALPPDEQGPLGTPRRGRDREATAGTGGGLAGTGRSERFRETLSNWGGGLQLSDIGPWRDGG